MINTRALATQYQLQEWAAIVTEQKSSGQSIKAYCEVNDIRPNAFFYWQRKLRETVAQEIRLPEPQQLPVPSGWAAVTEQTAKPTVSDELKTIPVEIGKFKVSVSAETDTELLVRTLKVLAELC
jgi:transposase-like protein